MTARMKTVDAALQARLRRHILAAGLLACTAMSAPALAQDAPAPADDPKEEIVVTGSLNALPLKDVGTVFGFDKNLVETPRSASSISKEQMERFGITEIYDLVAQSPGTFTNSFFGVGGALDIRGTPGEVYFRGMRRLDNPGNYPTPIGASDRIDIVRGPASPIFGPSKTGGYMNFVPKSARVANGKYMDSAAGQVTYTGGSWGKNVLSADIRGPGHLGTQEFGYSLYAEVEDSGSYYRNMSTKQTILQAAFDTDLASNLRLEFGGMYHDFKGQQNGGWNRLTQDLVDNGTYITGSAKPLDTNGDGQISHGEAAAANGGLGLNPFGSAFCSTPPFSNPFGGLTNACLAAVYPDMGLTNVGTAKLSRRDTLTGKNDRLDNTAKTGYLDLIFDAGEDFEIKNQLFYDGYTNINENTYGFSQFHDSWVIEDKIVISKTFRTDVGKFAIQASPSFRYTRFKHGDDFNYEYFHRVDLTKGYDALSDRLLSTECDCNYTSYLKGHYSDIGLAGLADLDFNFGLDLTLGARYDYLKVTTVDIAAKLEDPSSAASARGGKGAWSWSASANYKTPFGLVPYVTISRQSTVVAGQGAEIYAGDVTSGAFISASKLYEGGVKGTFLDNRLYAALSIYKQTRTDRNSQAIVTNQAVETKGIEAEVRWSVDKHLLLTANYTKTKVYNLTAIGSGALFSFFGIEDLKGLDPALFLGGQPIGLVPIANKEASRRAGIPEDLYSATATYSFDNGLAVAGSITHVPSVFSGQSQVVKLPAYTLVDASLSYATGPWLFRAVVKNLTDAKYFRANFTELFGSTIALPERPRSWQASVVYKF
ncbi:TonB-dependent receptor plug domain-containing protein [Novosphingobium olei]|nr:TonB-dependent receptor plug domain-containing protein [Novosphingobium olei]